MKTYSIYIKSHTTAPDYENETEANSLDEAAANFEKMLHGEYDIEFIKDNIMEEKNA